MYSLKILSKKALSFLVLFPVLASAQVTLQEWTFDDANGTIIGESSNSGNPGDWVFSDGLTDQQATVTNGALRFFGASTGDGILNAFTSGDTVFTTGIYELSLTVSDFSFSGEGTTGWVQFLIKSEGNNLIIFRVQESPSETLRLWLRSGSGGEFYALAGVNTDPGGTITISASINMDDQTFTCSIDSFNDNFDVVSMGPFPFNGTGDVTGLAIASQLNNATTETTDYLDISEIRLTGPEYISLPDTWAGYEIDENGWIDTAGFMGQLYINLDPWIWSENWGRWIYMPEEYVSDTGSWAYAGNL